MNIKKLFTFIAVILLFCLGLIFLVWCFLSTNSQLRDNLIAEIVGGGILASVITAVFFYLQEADEHHANKRKAESFYHDRLVLDIRESFDRNKSPWNFSGLQKFYFDDSRINSLYDIYEKNFSDINNFQAYFPANKLISVFNELYRLTRKGYVLAEKLEGEIYQLVRAEHHKRQLISANDFSSKAYIKGKLFANISDDVILKYLEWQTIPERIPQILEIAKKNPEISKLMKQITSVRNKLIQKENAIKTLLDKNITDA